MGTEIIRKCSICRRVIYTIKKEEEQKIKLAYQYICVQCVSGREKDYQDMENTYFKLIDGIRNLNHKRTGDKDGK